MSRLPYEQPNLTLCVRRRNFDVTEKTLWKNKVGYCKDNSTTQYKYHLHGREIETGALATLLKLQSLGLKAKLILAFLGVPVG